MKQTYLTNAHKVINELINTGNIITKVTRTGLKSKPRVKIYYDACRNTCSTNG